MCLRRQFRCIHIQVTNNAMSTCACPDKYVEYISIHRKFYKKRVPMYSKSKTCIYIIYHIFVHTCFCVNTTRNNRHSMHVVYKQLYVLEMTTPSKPTINAYSIQPSHSLDMTAPSKCLSNQFVIIQKRRYSPIRCPLFDTSF